ncbi:hypothetical protein M427DRAFT_50141 [Gonapodya prolifera JEL478]|uniref:Helicase ATP-binding domain-containing protein n=1 Tax=Gonapodya prolifera (strain JEL478) TaxID=1344416 RepID=A0A138ZWU9_GONPJ|nr:hypothetical protein M427DRAFT_50141 [Gonapodya prolifera JEL478]|eukprot:KXS08976.1 hypothetical protein M427DRAFT_50141 [Gonapodya prolifera JEL478]
MSAPDFEQVSKNLETVDEKLKFESTGSYSTHERRFGKDSGLMCNVKDNATHPASSYVPFASHVSNIFVFLEDWSNIWVAGGAVVSWIKPFYVKVSENNQTKHYGDIDMYIVCDNDSDFVKAVKRILIAVVKFADLKDMGVCFIMSEWAISIHSYLKNPIRDKKRNMFLREIPKTVQIILKRYKTIARLLSTFDVDCCGVAYNGSKIVATARAVMALKTKVNVADGSRNSPTFEYRLVKYAYHGFKIFIPNFTLHNTGDDRWNMSKHKGPYKILNLLAKKASKKVPSSVTTKSSDYAPCLYRGMSARQILLEVKLHNARIMSSTNINRSDKLWSYFTNIDDVMETVLDIGRLHSFVPQIPERNDEIQPKGHPDYPAPPPFKTYHFTQGGEYLVVPRYYGIKTFGTPVKICFPEITEIDRIQFLGTLKDYQVKPTELTLSHLREHGCGQLSLITGRGKTFCALKIAGDLKLPTLIIAHKTLLIDQWISEITKCIPTASVKRVQAKEKDFEADFVVATIQTLLSMDPSAIPDRFGFVIVDEVHHLGACHFNNIMSMCQAKYVLGLSATPERSDGLTKVIVNSIGPIIYKDDVKDGERGGTLWVLKHHGMNTQQLPWATRISALVADNARTIKLAEAIVRAAMFGTTEHKKRKFLIISDRTVHLEHIKTQLINLGVNQDDMGIFTGGSAKTKKTKVDPLDKQYILSTYSMFSEGVSRPDLNTLVLATPKKEIVQVIGRIYRKTYTADDVQPLIVDMIDNGFNSQFYARKSTGTSSQYRKYMSIKDNSEAFDDYVAKVFKRNNSRLLQYQADLEDPSRIARRVAKLKARNRSTYSIGKWGYRDKWQYFGRLVVNGASLSASGISLSDSQLAIGIIYAFFFFPIFNSK